MRKLNKYHGVVVPMVTPVTKEGDIDVKALAGNCVSEQMEAAKKFVAAGADVIAATLPCYYALTPEQMMKYYTDLADVLTIPLMLYNITITTHMSIPVDVIEKLSHHPNIVGLKDSEDNQERMEEILRLVADRDDFAYFCGCAANSAKALSLGADGIVPSVGNYLPKMYADLFDAGVKGDTATAENLQQKTIEIGNINTAGLTLGQSLAGLKVIMKMVGLCDTFMLPPLTELDDDTVKRIQEQAKEVI